MPFVSTRYSTRPALACATAFSTSVVTVPLKFKFNSVGNLLSGLINRSLKKDYELTGSAKMGFFSIPFNKKGEVNLAK